MVLYMAGVNQWICIALGIISASVLVWATFHLNAKYGEWGLMKIQAAKNHPRYIISRKRFLRLIIPNLKTESHEKCNESSYPRKQVPDSVG